MRKFMPLVFLMSILVIGITVQGFVLGQDTPTPTPTETATETATLPPTNTATEPPTLTLTPTLTETPTSLPTETLIPTSTETATLTPTVDTTISATPTEIGTITETPIGTASLTPTLPVGTATSTLFPTPTIVSTLPAPTGLTRMFFFQGLSDTNVDIYANGLQIGGNVETGRMLGTFSVLDGTATTLLLFPAGNLGQPTIYSTLSFDPGSTVLVVAFNGAGGVPSLAVYRLDTAPGQSQIIAINASDAPTLDVVTSSYPTTSIAQGFSTQITIAPGNTANLADSTGKMTAQGGSLTPQALAPGVAYLQIAVGSVANGTYRVITQAIDVNTMRLITP